MDSHTDYCTEQVFPLVWRRIPIPLLKYSKIGMEICPWNGDPSLKWVQQPSGKVFISVSVSVPVEKVLHSTM